MKEIDLDKEVRNTGIALIILGIIHMIFSGFLSFTWGIILIVLGIISFFYRSRKMILTFGISLILVGALNLLDGILASLEGISAGWAIFGVFQIIWGIQEINRFREIKENPKYLNLEKGFAWYGLRIGFFIMVVNWILNYFVINQEATAWATFVEFFIISVIFTFVTSIIHLKFYKQETFAIISLVISLLMILTMVIMFILPDDLNYNDIDYTLPEYKYERACEKIIPERFNVFCNEVGMTSCFTNGKIGYGGDTIYTKWADGSKVIGIFQCDIGYKNGENMNYLYCKDKGYSSYSYYNKSYDNEGFITETEYRISLILDYTDHTEEGYKVISYECI